MAFIPEIFKDINRFNVKAAWLYFLDNGSWKLICKIFGKIWGKYKYRLLPVAIVYQIWIFKNRQKNDAILIAETGVPYKQNPLFSFIVFLPNANKGRILKIVKSFLGWSYSLWNLHFISDRPLYDSFLPPDERISLQPIKDPVLPIGLSRMIRSLGRDYVAIIKEDFILAPIAFGEAVKAINEDPEAGFIYSDEDNISRLIGLRTSPQFKSDYNPCMFEYKNYMGDILFVKKTIGNRAGWFSAEGDAVDMHSFLLRLDRLTTHIVHIRKILFHRVKDFSATKKLLPTAATVLRKQLEFSFKNL